ncbi:MAG: hypothetical protein M3153_05480 [Chloroflexota bacterium]|nr:hypothetical protein [Chloroflexota bacterium]
MKTLLRDYGLGVVLALLFLVSWILQSLTGWVEFASEQQTHGQAAQLFGDSGYFWRWMQATFENWQSEFLQLFTMVVLTAFLIHKASHESRDGQEEMKMAIIRVEERLMDLQSTGGRDQ